MWRHSAQQRITPVKREATIAGLASEGLALISDSAGTGSSASTPTDPVEFRKCARDLKTLSAARKHTNEERGGSRDPGVRRPAQVAVSCQHARRSLFLSTCSRMSSLAPMGNHFFEFIVFRVHDSLILFYSKPLPSNRPGLIQIRPGLWRRTGPQACALDCSSKLCQCMPMT